MTGKREEPPPDLTKYNRFAIEDAFTISVPETMEPNDDTDKHTRWLLDNMGAVHNAEAVFQQKGLSVKDSDACRTYARVMIRHFTYPPGEAGHHYETYSLTEDDYAVLREMADAELVGLQGQVGRYVRMPTYEWTDIGGTKALVTAYERTGLKGPVNCRIYLLCNYDEMAKIIVSYRERDSLIWKKDLDNVIRTFKWSEPK